MSINSTENTLDVIEVPPELRGLSDEEIIKNSEKPLREVSGKRKNGAKRPAKNVRAALKMQNELHEITKAATELFEKGFDKKISNISFYDRGNADMQVKAYSRENDSYSFYDVNLKKERSSRKNEDYLTTYVTEKSKPTEGRVLKASFGSIAKRILVKK